jgi:hypothetical protein
MIRLPNRQSTNSLSALSPVGISLNGSSYGHVQDATTLLNTSQQSPRSVCMSPRPGSSGALMELGPPINGFHRSCSPGSLSGGSSSPGSLVSGQQPSNLASSALNPASSMNFTSTLIGDPQTVTVTACGMLSNSHTVSYKSKPNASPSFFRQKEDVLCLSHHQIDCLSRSFCSFS